MVIPKGAWVGCPVCAAHSDALDRIRPLVRSLVCHFRGHSFYRYANRLICRRCGWWV